MTFINRTGSEISFLSIQLLLISFQTCFSPFHSSYSFSNGQCLSLLQRNQNSFTQINFIHMKNKIVKIPTKGMSIATSFLLLAVVTGTLLSFTTQKLYDGL